MAGRGCHGYAAAWQPGGQSAERHSSSQPAVHVSLLHMASGALLKQASAGRNALRVMYHVRVVCAWKPPGTPCKVFTLQTGNVARVNSGAAGGQTVRCTKTVVSLHCLCIFTTLGRMATQQ
jgi:hypothetical protein